MSHAFAFVLMELCDEESMPATELSCLAERVTYFYYELKALRAC
jgi:hypothetical protein